MSRSIALQLGFASEIQLRGMVAAVGRAERAHPFAGVFVLRGREAVEIARA